MILNVSAKSLALLLVIGVASTTGSNLRQRRATLFNHGHEADAAAASTVSKQSGSNSNGNLRSPSVSTASASEDITAEEEEEPASVSVATEPSIELDQSTYLEDDAISVTFSVGSPTHPYYSSSEAPSRSLDHDYPTWSIGLFMRDADPQGGTLSPIVSINVCGAMGSDCDVNDRSFASYGDRTVTFGSEYLDVMQGRWPLEVSQYGTGFDAYVLDGNGAAAIGPLEFYIQSELDEDVDTTHAHGSGAASYHPKSSSSSSSSMVESSSSIKSNTSTNPLLKYGKGTKKVSERQHASVSAAAKKANAKLGSANGLEMSGNAIPSDPSIHKVASTTEESSTPGGQCCQGSITTPKDEYEYDDNVSIDFSIDSNLEVLANYKIGIFMRMAHPQGGALEPVVSLPLCSTTTNNEGSTSCITTDNLTYSGSVTFSQESMTSMIGAPEWPIDLYQWGTGFDAYILNENGADVVGPVKFNIMMDDTY